MTLQAPHRLKLAAKLADMPIEEFKFLNPGHNKPVIKAGEAERIVLPRHKVAVFPANFEKHDTPLVSWQAVTLRAGQKAGARRRRARHDAGGVEAGERAREPEAIVPGQPLLVPLKDGAGDPQLPDLPATPVSLPKAIQAAKAGQRGSESRRAERRQRSVMRPERGRARPRDAQSPSRTGQRAQVARRAGKRVKVGG